MIALNDGKSFKGKVDYSNPFVVALGCGLARMITSAHKKNPSANRGLPMVI